MKWVTPAERDWYYRRGSMIHKAVAMMDAGTLDWSSLDSNIESYVRGAQKFRQECGGTLIAAEIEVQNTALNITGHFDAIYKNMRMKGHRGKYCLVDWKTNAVDEATQIQTAGYASMWNENVISFRAGVALLANGNYKVTWYPYYYSDYGGWMGAVALAKWKLRNGNNENGEQAQREELI